MSENMNPVNDFRRPKWVAGSVLVAGLVASIAGNIQSILLEESSPGVGSMISALWWPAILFGMIELAIHTPWGKTPLWLTVQWSGSGIIGAVAFYISYFHLAHVLSSFGYDTVSRFVGPIAVDVAMAVATLAMNRIGAAKAKLASGQPGQKAKMASGQEKLANREMASGQEKLATGPVGQEELATDDLASEWANLDAELDAELAEMVATAQAAPEPIETAPEPASDRAPVALTKVPTEAAKRIQEALELDAKATAAAIARDLVAAGLADSDRSGRRYVAAVKNGTAKVA